MERPTPFHRIRKRSADIRGDTLVEVAIAAAISVVVLGAIVSFVVVVQRTEVSTANYAYAQSTARSGLNTMVSEIRAAWNVISAGPNYVDMDVDLNGTAYQVYYECDVAEAGTSYNECVRLQATVGAALPSLSTGSPAITNLENGTATSPVFSWSPDAIAPYYMTATIDVPAASGSTTRLGLGLSNTVVFSDGALMRNENVQN